MRYLLNEHFRLRAWYQQPTGLLDIRRKEAHFLSKNAYMILLQCDGAHDLQPETMPEEDRLCLESFVRDKIVRPVMPGNYLRPEQEYKTYPAGYRRNVHWSITGLCNMKCRHCFMSAPHARHGNPSREELLRTVDQLAECGIFQVGITGGEPLIRDDFLEIVDRLKAHEIGVSTIFTNGWLVNEELLDALESRRMHPGFQLSFDGIGWHDFLRGIPGAEEKTLRALRLLQARRYNVSVSMCLHRKNAETIRETVRLMASLGVSSMKCNVIMDLGEWAGPDLQDLKLTREEEEKIYETYIPQYFEDGAPLAISLGGAFTYTPGEKEWRIHYECVCSEADEDCMPSCGILLSECYIGADGMVAPCMAMCDTNYAHHFPNLRDMPLWKILRDSEVVRLCQTSVGDVRHYREQCAGCEWIGRCIGGCRSEALRLTDDYYAADPVICSFYRNGWDKAIRAAAQPAFEAYLRRNPLKEGQRMEAKGDLSCP